MSDLIEQNIETRELYQIEYSTLDGFSEFKIVAIWQSIKDVTNTLGYYREGIDQAIKKGFISSGYFWMWNYDWNAGKRPNLNKQIRNKRIYAYLIKGEEKIFVNRYKNSVIASKDLSVSVSNIRLVCDNEKYGSTRQSHKDYFFSYKPLYEEDDILADIIGLRELRNELRDKTSIDLQINEKKKELNEIQNRTNKNIDLESFEKNSRSQMATMNNTRFQ